MCPERVLRQRRREFVHLPGARCRGRGLLQQDGAPGRARPDALLGGRPLRILAAKVPLQDGATQLHDAQRRDDDAGVVRLTMERPRELCERAEGDGGGFEEVIRLERVAEMLVRAARDLRLMRLGAEFQNDRAQCRAAEAHGGAVRQSAVQVRAEDVSQRPRAGAHGASFPTGGVAAEHAVDDGRVARGGVLHRPAPERVAQRGAVARRHGAPLGQDHFLQRGDGLELRRRDG
mmetsp:Transcript_15386/g.51836  ORF Transcript_15386/g.51836 Transcript_15386/m.51836 type:complete len:233 (-) Transcript_15386:218-916(-)